MSQVTGQEASNKKAIITAIRHLGGSKSSSVAVIQRYLPSQHVNGKPELKTTQLGLKNDAGKGLLSKLNDGKFQIKETARRRRSRSRSRRRKSTPKRRSRSRKRSGSRRRKRSGSGKRRRRRSSSGRKRKRSTSKRRRRRPRKQTPEEE